MLTISDVVHRDRAAARSAQDMEDQEIADAFGTRKPEAQVCAFGNSAALFAPSRTRARSAHSLRLHVTSAAARADPAQRLHLVERLPHPDQSGAAAGRIEDHVGQLPAELLGQLVADVFFPSTR